MPALKADDERFSVLKAGQVWKHYKGQFYEIVALPRASSNDDWVDGTLQVVYRQYDAPRARPWVQPAERFLGLVQAGEDLIPRFTLHIEQVLPNPPMPGI